MQEENETDLGYILAPENQLETIALARALCPFAEQATDATMLICVAMVETKGDLELISQYLALDKARVRAHYQSHLSNRIVRELTRHKLTGEGYMIAVGNLMEVAQSRSQTGTARNNASKTLIDLAEAEAQKDKGKHGDGKDLNEMTLAELESLVNTVKSDMASLTGESVAIPDKSPCAEQGCPE